MRSGCGAGFAVPSRPTATTTASPGGRASFAPSSSATFRNWGSPSPPPPCDGSGRCWHTTTGRRGTRPLGARSAARACGARGRGAAGGKRPGDALSVEAAQQGRVSRHVGRVVEVDEAVADDRRVDDQDYDQELRGEHQDAARSQAARRRAGRAAGQSSHARELARSTPPIDHRVATRLPAVGLAGGGFRVDDPSRRTMPRRRRRMRRVARAMSKPVTIVASALLPDARQVLVALQMKGVALRRDRFGAERRAGESCRAESARSARRWDDAAPRSASATPSRRRVALCRAGPGRAPAAALRGGTRAAAVRWSARRPAGGIRAARRGSA